MKIALITETLSPHSGARAPLELAKALGKKHQLTLFAFQKNPQEKIPKKTFKKPLQVVLIPFSPSASAKIKNLLKFLPQIKTNQVISFHGTILSFLVLLFAKKPIITTYYGTQLNAFLERIPLSQKPSLTQLFLNKLGNQLILLTQRIFLIFSSQTIAISRYTQKEIWQLYRKKIPFVHLGSNKLKNPSPLKTTRPFILSVSRFTPYKNFHLLLKLFEKSQIKESLFLVGSPSQPHYLRYLQKLASSKVKIIKNPSDQILANLYKDCSFYASCDRYLFFGLPPLEAAHFQKPSLLLNRCAAPEIVRHQKTGLLAQNEKEFTTFLKTLSKSPRLVHKMGRQAQENARQNFSWSKCAREYEKIFRRYDL